MTIPTCCLQAFQWDGKPKGKTVNSFPTASNQAYVTGSNPDIAVLYVADLLGSEFVNARLLADHLAEEVNATVYVPDLCAKSICLSIRTTTDTFCSFAGESLPTDILLDQSRWGEIDMPGFIQKNSRSIREPEILACAKKLRTQYKKVGAVGYCYGGWAVFRLGAVGNNLVDCITAGHPSLLTKEDIDLVDVPTQLLAPEIDPVYTAELKEHTWRTLPTKGIAFDYQHFPKVRCFSTALQMVPGLVTSGSTHHSAGRACMPGSRRPQQERREGSYGTRQKCGGILADSVAA